MIYVVLKAPLSIIEAKFCQISFPEETKFCKTFWTEFNNYSPLS